MDENIQNPFFFKLKSAFDNSSKLKPLNDYPMTAHTDRKISPVNPSSRKIVRHQKTKSMPLQLQ